MVKCRLTFIVVKMIISCVFCLCKGCSSTGSSGGPSSPTISGSNPDDIIRTLRLLINRTSSDVVTSQGADTDSVSSLFTGNTQSAPRGDTHDL